MKKALFAVGAAALLFVSFLTYLGYFGGPVFVPVPATATPARGEAGTVAILLSGDMGFNMGMGPQVAHRLAADGIPVLGINSLSYFRVRRSPAQNESLIAEAMHRALAMPEARSVILIGQSFGADMLQAGLPALPQAMRSKVALVALVVPGDTIDFRASPSELFSLEPPDAQALPTARLLNWVPAICIHGIEEPDSLCPLLDLPNVRRITLPGGHPLRHDIARVHAELLTAIRAALASRPLEARHPSADG